MNRLRVFTLAFVCTLFTAFTLHAQDVVTVGSVSAAAGTRVSVPVSIRDVSGTPLDANGSAKHQGFAIRVRISPASAATSLTFTRGGITTPMVARYEETVGSTDSIAYIATFTNPIPLLINSPAPGDRIGTIGLTIAPGLAPATAITLSIDADATTLSNHDGSQTQTVAETNLVLVSGTVTVGGSPTSVALTSSRNPSVVDQSVTFSASVASPTAGTIGGWMQFRSNDALLALVKVVNGVAAFTTSTLPEGTHRIAAAYEGGGSYQPSGSATLNQTVNSSLIAAPVAVSATALTANRIDVSWASVANAASYEIVRRASVTGGETVVGTSTGTSFTDLGVTTGKTYLYAVRALTAAGARSAASALDPATTFAFSDPSLSGKTVKRAHLTELRAAINEFRRAAGLPAYAFAEGTLPSRAVVKRVHIEELRSAGQAARAALGLATSFTDPSLSGGIRVKAAHFEELRAAVR